MDIHKPRAVHGWREFATEIGVIVIGVLIALGGEQIVEAIHWSHKVEDARVRLKHELGALDAYAFERDRVDGCLDKRLTELRAGLLAGAGRWTPLAQMESLSAGPVAYVVPHRQWSDEVWRALNADGTAGHMPPELQQRYGDLYARAAQILAYDNAEYVDVGSLNVLDFEAEIPVAQRLQFAAQIEQERRRNRLISLLSRQMMVRNAQLGAHDEASDLDWMRKASNTYRACAKLALLPAGSPPPNMSGDSVANGLLR